MKLNGESYAHAAARMVLAGWLRPEDCEPDGFNPRTGWRPNRWKPLCGVYEEFPIIPGINVSPLDYLVAHGAGAGNVQMHDENGLARADGSCMSFDEIVASGKPAPMIVFDIAYAHKGNIVGAYEVVHKNPISEEKRFLINLLDVVVWEIDARWILAQVETQPPQKLSRRLVNSSATWRGGYRPPVLT